MIKSIAKWFTRLCRLVDSKHKDEYDDEQIDVYLIDVPGRSGKTYCIQFECDTQDDCMAMLLDTGINDDYLGKLVDSVPFDERTYH